MSEVVVTIMDIDTYTCSGEIKLILFTIKMYYIWLDSSVLVA